ncbi:hypothetical protein DNTS_028619 [Danionella cerebrum]|uniref:IBB domain-containing protein n=1 Tax=Danionella cerebrum TaxID=2873325 RepID=A0A553QLD5_9TELE|nr:hypothetical protein DNTS_028619 [Danionella translucida]
MATLQHQAGNQDMRLAHKVLFQRACAKSLYRQSPRSSTFNDAGKIQAVLTGSIMSQGKDNARLKSYKNNSLNTDEMRRRREEEGLQIRKQKKDEQVRFLNRVY